MTQLIVRVSLQNPPELLHLLRTPSVAAVIFVEEESRLRPDQGLWHLRVNPLHWPHVMDREMAEAWTREYGACLRAGALQATRSAFGRAYAFQDDLRESA